MNSKMTLSIALTLFLAVSTPTRSIAQNLSLTLPAGTAKCLVDYEKDANLNVCVSRDAGQFVSARQDTRERCESGFATLPGLTFCVLNKRSVHLQKTSSLFHVFKSDGNGCRAGFESLAGNRFCVDQNLHLERLGAELILTARISDDCTDDNQQAQCDGVQACQLGFVRSLGRGLCVEWALAEQGHPRLNAFNHQCQNSRYWMKHSPQGLCVPKHNVVSVINTDTSAMARELSHGTDCPGGVPQVITIATGTAGDNAGTSNTLPAVGQNIGGFKMVPVVMCSPPSWIRAMH